MSDKSMTQDLADELQAVEKVRTSEKVYDYPGPGEHLSMDLVSLDGREEFVLDINRRVVNIRRRTFQSRARATTILARLDIEGPIHENPDGELVPPPHIHIYREGYGTKWAYPLPPEHFQDPSDPTQTFSDFLRYCNVTRPPLFQEGLL